MVVVGVGVCELLSPTVCDPMDCSPPGSSVHGTLQARILEWVAISLGIFLTQEPNLGLLHCRQILYYLSHQGSCVCVCVCVHTQLLSSVQLYTTLWTEAHQVPLSMGFFQARILNWITVYSSTWSSGPRDQTCLSVSPALAGRFFTPDHLGSLYSSDSNSIYYFYRSAAAVTSHSCKNIQHTFPLLTLWSCQNLASQIFRWLAIN